MKFRNILLFCCLVLILPVVSATPGPQKNEESNEPAKPCCFTRAGYQGVCQVTPSEGETCESILNYLNTVGTIGKSYCGASKLRGEWKAVECPAEEAKE